MIKGYIQIDSEVCKGCELCIEACPRDSLALSKSINHSGFRYVELKEDNCTGCTNCALVCPDAAIKVYRQAKPNKAV